MHSLFYKRSFAIVTAALLGYALFLILRPFFGALVWAAFLAFMLHPLHKRLTVRLRNRPSLSATLLTLATPVAVILPLAGLGGMFVAQAAAVAVRLRDFARGFDRDWLGRLERYPLIEGALAWLSERIDITAAQVQEWVASGGEGMLKYAASLGGSLVVGTLETVFSFFLMLVLLFFFLRDGRELVSRPVRLIPLEPQRRSALIKHLGKVTRALVYGTGITALVQGILTGIGFALSGLPSAVFFGVVAFVLSLLPFVGSALVWIPGVIYLAAVGRWGAAIFLLVWGAIVSVSDNILRPLVVARQAPVAEITVFVGVLGGAAAFGAIGLIAGPLLLALIVGLLQFADEVVEEQGAG